jgi:hypothetical protein
MLLICVEAGKGFDDVTLLVCACDMVIQEKTIRKLGLGFS